MSANISQAELTLLQYLHERSGISGGRIGLDPTGIRRALRISMTQLIEDALSLAAQGLCGVRNQRPGANEVPSSVCSAIWVTRKGEDFLTQNAAQRRAAKSPSAS